MERIGDFSKRCEATIKTLRYYDKLGLLVPDYIDKFTGYRYYDLEKVEEMRRITELKNIGFSLEEIKLFCSADNENKKEQILWEKRKSLEKLSKEITQQLLELNELEQKFLPPERSSGLKGEKKMENNFNMPFVNDENVIGRWEIITSVEKKEDFIYSQNYANATPFEEIYFLPDGEQYWGFSWTKDYIKITFGNGLLCPYTLEKTDGEQYMFMEYHKEIWVLRQADKKRYTKYEIGRYDNINLPFIDDENVMGKWTSVDFVYEINDFIHGEQQYKGVLFFKSVEFLPGGRCKKQYAGSGEFFCGWTKGTLLERSGDGTKAPAYEIRKFDGTDYLFLEWKSGDYIWGRRKPGYYVFKRD